MMVLLCFGLSTGSLYAAAINYTTTSYCPTETTFTSTEQTTTYYLGTSNSTAFGNCSVNWNMFDQNHYAAIEPGDWQNGAPCGACAVLNYNSHSTTVMIVDQCATCATGSHHLDLAPQAYGELVGSPGCANISGSSNGSVNTGGCPAAPGANQVTWHFIQCPLTGSANIEVNNPSGNITYIFKDGSSSGWHPVVFWDMFFPIQSVGISNSSGGPFSNVPRDTSDSIPQYWGGTAGGNLSPPFYYKITDDRNNSVTLGPINSVSPVQATSNSSFVAFGTSSSQLPGCVVGPTNTPTKTNTPGSPTATFTPTFTVTPTPTLGGCVYTYYDGETSSTNLASGSNWTGNATLAENAAAAQSGTNGMNIAYNWPAASYYAEVGWNWAGYSATSPRIVNLANYSYLEINLKAAAGSPVTLGLILADYGGGGSGGVTASAPYTIVLGDSNWHTFDISTGAFATGGASWSTSKVGEIDLEVFAPATAGTATVYMDNFGFRGTCPTNTPTWTATSTPTATPTGPTATPTSTPQCYSFDTFEEDGGLTGGWMDNLGGYWGGFAGPPATGITVVSGGAAGTTVALQASASSAPSAGTVGISGGIAAAQRDLSYLTGMTFWFKTNASASTTFRVNLDNPTIDAGSGDNYGYNFTGTSTWQQVTIPLSSFVTQGYGTTTMTLSQALTQVQALNFQDQTVGATPVTFWLDQICLMSSNPPPTKTFTPTATYTFTPTYTRTNTPTFTITNTATNSPTATATFTRTNSPTATATFTYSNTATNTPTNPVVTNTPTFTATNSLTATPTLTATESSTRTATSTPTATWTGTLTPPNTDTPTHTPTVTATMTATSSSTATPTFTLTTGVMTATFTRTATNSPTSTPTLTSTSTRTSTPTFTSTSTATLTPTATFTGTVTPPNTGTPTSTPTLTGTSTQTFTPSNTSTSSVTPTATDTSTFTATSTPTSSPTLTVTATATAPVVSVSLGTSSPGGSNLMAGANNVAVLQVQVGNPSSVAVTLTGLKLTGTANSSTGISQVALYVDSNNNGILDAGDTNLALGSYSGNTATLSFNAAVPAGSSVNYIVVYNFSPTAPTGTYQVSIVANGDVSGTGPGGGAIQVTGAPVNGASFTVVAATATPTSTPTVTWTPTVTPTWTPTPIGQVSLLGPYPNPSDGGPVTVNVEVPASSTVKWSVFTLAFREIVRGEETVTSTGQVVWNLTDRNGSPVASGLYYLRVEVDGLQTTSRVFKVLVLR